MLSTELKLYNVYHNLIHLFLFKFYYTGSLIDMNLPENCIFDKLCETLYKIQNVSVKIYFFNQKHALFVPALYTVHDCTNIPRSSKYNGFLY